jgi:hypothetical protein
MSESKKLLIGFGVVAVICCCAAGTAFLAMREFGRKMDNFASGEPTAVARIRENIAAFEIPPGYSPIAMSFLGYDVVSLTPDRSGPGMMIMLMQYSSFAAGSAEQMEEQLRQAAERQVGRPGASMQVVEVRQEVIRGETVEVTVSEGTFEGLIMRQWTAIFSGNQGPTILMVQAPLEAWDEDLLEKFITSIR